MASMNPQIRDLYSPLEELIMQALRQHGEFAPSSVDGDVSLMLMEFANEVVEEVNSHPYWTGEIIEPYVSIQEARAIPDNIIMLGMLFHYSVQQNSSKAQYASEKFFRTMNQKLYRTKHGTLQPTFDQSFQ
jgi:hypothetical protein